MEPVANIVVFNIYVSFAEEKYILMPVTSDSISRRVVVARPSTIFFFFFSLLAGSSG